MIKKKFNWLFILLIVMLLIGQPVSAESKINVVIDGKLRVFDAEPMIYDGSTFVPMRGIFEALGAVIEWDGVTRTVTSTKGSTTVEITIDAATALVNGSEAALIAPAMVVDNRTMVPLRFVSEALGAKVEWDGSTRTVYIEQKANLSLIELAKLNSGVVLIDTFGPYGVSLGSGSGTIISPDGLIVTNYHVIDSTTDASVILADGQVYPVVGVYYYSVDQDIAILKIDETNLPAISLGSSDQLELGQEIVALGSPLGLQNSISAGIISGLNRVYEDQSYLQITAPISPGNSGGALLNYQGELVGIPTWQFIEGQNMNMAIPISVVQAVLPGLTNNRLLSIAEVFKENLWDVSYEEFVDYIHWDYFPTILGDSYLDSEAVGIEEQGLLGRTIIYLNIWLDEESYGNFQRDLATYGTENLEEVFSELGALTKMAFNKPYVGRLLYESSYHDYPAAFPADTITLVDEVYQVELTLAEFMDYGDGRLRWKTLN